MFWKKKPKAAEPLFTYEGSSPREYARAQPTPAFPLVARVADQVVEVIDVSAGGLAFRSSEVTVGRVYSVRVELPHGNPVVAGNIEILSVDDQAACHGRFLELTENMTEALHQYVLEAQKAALREKRDIKPPRLEEE